MRPEGNRESFAPCHGENARQTFGKNALGWRDGASGAATALALALSFPSLLDRGFWFLAWGAWIPLFGRVATRATFTIRQALLLGTGVALVFFYGSFWWLTFPITHYGGIPAPIAYVLLLLPALVLAIFFSLFLWFVRWGIARWGRRGILLSPFFGVALEWGRYRLTGHGWNLLGYSQAPVPELIQIARVAGVLGVSFLLFLASALGVFFVLGHAGRRRRAAFALGVPLGILGLTFLGGRVVRPSQDPVPGASAVQIFAVQPVVPVMAGSQGVSTPDVAESLRRHLHLSELLLSEETDRVPVRLLIWPESPMNISLDVDQDVASLLSDFARQQGVYLLLNHLGRAAHGWHNSAAVISPQGERIADYHKIRLLEFGEYVPGRRWIPFLKKIPALAGDFVPGQTYTVVSLGSVRLGTFICFESAFPEIPRALVRRGATLLVNLSNDGWFGTTTGARQHLHKAVLRAVEMGRPLVRVTNSGITALITPFGEVRDPTPLFQVATRHWILRPAPESSLTFYAQHGDLFAWLCVAVSLGAIVWGMHRKKHWGGVILDVQEPAEPEPPVGPNAEAGRWPAELLG